METIRCLKRTTISSSVNVLFSIQNLQSIRIPNCNGILIQSIQRLFSDLRNFPANRNTSPYIRLCNSRTKATISLDSLMLLQKRKTSRIRVVAPKGAKDFSSTILEAMATAEREPQKSIFWHLFYFVSPFELFRDF